MEKERRCSYVFISFHLSDGHPADGGIQDAGVGVGAHFGHEAEPLPPANTVLLNLLPEDVKRNSHRSISRINTFTCFQLIIYTKGLRKHFPLAVKLFFGRGQTLIYGCLRRSRNLKCTGYSVNVHSGRACCCSRAETSPSQSYSENVAKEKEEFFSSYVILFSRAS